MNASCAEWLASEGKKTAVVSTINGDSNGPFYKELGNAGLKATDVPVVAFSVGEEELRGIDTKPLVGQTFKAPSGIVSKMDEKNHHLHKSVFIGEVKAYGQFNVVWKTPGPVKAQPWSPFIASNDKKKDEPEVK